MNGTSEIIIGALVTIMVALAGSGGLWAYLQRRADDRRREEDSHDAKTQLLLGLAHEKVINLGMKYISRGYITKDEYEDFHRYLWKPYSTFGGNGLAEKVFETLRSLPIMPTPPPGFDTWNRALKDEGGK